MTFDRSRAVLSAWSISETRGTQFAAWRWAVVLAVALVVGAVALPSYAGDGDQARAR